ncbi:MAG: iron-sulfur cluster assembly scaffold protein [Candidatus Aminicenantaceae bacterium]
MKKMDKDKEIDYFVQETQEQLMKQLKKQYSETVIDHWQNPRNFEKCDNADGYASVKGSCGDTMEMFVKVKNGKIEQCTFQTDGCGTTMACGSMVTEITKGKSFTEALALVNTEEILKRLGGLPAPDVHCAQLASGTLRRSLADYLNHRKNLWKKFYRKT